MHRLALSYPILPCLLKNRKSLLQAVKPQRMCVDTETLIGDTRADCYASLSFTFLLLFFVFSALFIRSRLY